jgi:hypothetical protein
VGALGAAAAALVMAEFFYYVYKNDRLNRKNDMRHLSKSSRNLRLRVVAAVRALVAALREQSPRNPEDSRLDETVFQTREIRRPL